ncbi:MAG: fibrobacter succinogenes major paralogous domain-containing protein [Fibrobacter sp.]|nr:fibrobacter succinogenes major paralogous domain-containing protein [Fibrobacter sp.]
MNLNKLKPSFLLLSLVVGMAVCAACSGEDGAAGPKGEDGENCTLSDTTQSDRSGIAITCGDEVRVVWNGTDGKDGDKGKTGPSGKDGEPCKLTGDTTLTEIKIYMQCGDEDKVFIASVSSCTAYPDDKKPNWSLMNADADYSCFKDSRDDQVYRAVKIGKQLWMAENLNYDPGDVSKLGKDAWSGCYAEGEKDVAADSSDKNCTIYGRLYTWEVAMNNGDCAFGSECKPNGVTQGICPDGWHIPDVDEWETLWLAVGGASTAGTKLKSTSGWDNDGNGEDDYGFAVLPAGGFIGDEDFDLFGKQSYFWTSNEDTEKDAFDWIFDFKKTSADKYNDYKNYGNSVRCVKD